MPRLVRTLLRSRFVAGAASLVVVAGVSLGGAAVSHASEDAAPHLDFISPTALGGLTQASGIGVDPALHVAVVEEDGGYGSLWSINTHTLAQTDHVATPIATKFSHAYGTLDAKQHVVYLGETYNCGTDPKCTGTPVPGLTAAAGVPAPEIVTVPISPAGHFLPAKEYTLPSLAAGASVVAMRPIAINGRHLLYVLVSRVHDQFNTGMAHQSTLFELDADVLRGLATPSTATEAVVWAHDVSSCSAFAGAPKSYLGVDPAGRFAYFDCRNMVVNNNNFTSGGAVVVDFPQALPTAEQEQNGSFVTTFYPAGAPTASEQSSGDPTHNLLIQAVADGNHNKLYVFDAEHRAWTGSVPVPEVGSNLWGIAVDQTNGESYTVGDSSQLVASQGTSLPVRIGGTISLGHIHAQGGNGPPLFDPETGRLFMFGASWVDNDGQRVNDVAAVVYTDPHRFAPVDDTPPDPDQFTHDVPITPDTDVSYQAIASGYGLRVVQVGGLSATQASQVGAVNVSNPAYSIDTDCAYAGLPCDGVVPSIPDGSRAVTLARTDVSTQSSGVTGNATPYELDATTQSEYSSLTTPGTFLHGYSRLTGSEPPDAPGAPAPPDQVSQQVAPATCSDYSSKPQDNTQTAARTQCDNAGRFAAAVAVAPGPGAASPVQVGYATTRIDKASQSASGAEVDITSEAHGIVVGVPGGPTMRIGSVITHATSKAIGQSKSAVSTFSRTISDVTISDPSGAEVFSCGFATDPSCDPRQLTDEYNKQSTFPVEFLLPEPDGYYGRTRAGPGAETLPGSPGGAQAEVIKTAYDYFNDKNINGDASFEVPGLQIIMVNDGQQPSRLVYSFAAVHAESHQNIGLPPAPAEELAAPSLELTLVDGSTPPVPLAGGAFTVQGPDGVQPVACLTGADGIGTCKLEKLKPGAYTISETTAPPGFAPVDDYELTLEPGQDYKTAFVNLPAIGSVDLTLSAPGEEAAPIPDAAFALMKDKDELGTPLATCTTDDKGECHFPKVPLGAYTMVQTSAPDGFLVSESLPFTLTKPAQLAELHFVDGIPGKEAIPPTFIPGKPAVPPKVIPGKPAVPPKVIPGKPAVPPRTMVLPALSGTGDAALEPAGYDTASGPAPVVASQPSGTGPLALGNGGLSAVSARLARLVIHSPQQAVLLLFVWLVLGLPVYLWVRRQQFITATEGI